MPDASYYGELLTSEWRTAPKMLAWLAANLQPYQDALSCISSFLSAFDIDTAVGPQLDILGAIIGRPRTLEFQPSNGVSPVLEDVAYRFLLKARIYWNHWDGRTMSILTMWKLLFPGGTLIFTDNQDMSISLYVAGAFTSITKDLISNGYIIPRPQAVLYNIRFANLPMLGFDRTDEFVSGLDEGLFT